MNSNLAKNLVSGKKSDFKTTIVLHSIIISKYMETNFKAPWDLRVILTTIGLLLVLGGSVFIEPSVIHLVIILTITLGGASFGVYGYSIQNDKLKIIRLGWAKEIKIKEITNVHFTSHAMMGSIRTFGIGGLFGYIGNYRNGVLGVCRTKRL